MAGELDAIVARFRLAGTPAIGASTSSAAGSTARIAPPAGRVAA